MAGMREATFKPSIEEILCQNGAEEMRAAPSKSTVVMSAVAQIPRRNPSLRWFHPLGKPRNGVA